MNLKFLILFSFAFTSYGHNLSHVGVKFSSDNLLLQIGATTKVNVSLSQNLPVELNITLESNQRDVVKFRSRIITFLPNSTENVVYLKGLHAKSNVIVNANCSDSDEYYCSGFFRLTVLHSQPLVTFCAVIGWIYFLAWSISFYPQILKNFRRKCVVGLDFNFLALNITGFTCYAIYNCCLFWSPVIQKQYFVDNPFGEIPVLANDVFFSVHAVFACFITICQCFYYESGQQRVSITCIVLLCIMWLCAFITLILGAAHVMTWLAFLTGLSYIKLSVTLIKYVPQAYLNFLRKSTVGWSIGNVLLDFTGGVLSMLQLLLQAYNYEDWSEIFTDFTKFGLGMFSILFDILFIVQHYYLYRDAEQYEPEILADSSDPDQSSVFDT